MTTFAQVYHRYDEYATSELTKKTLHLLYFIHLSKYFRNEFELFDEVGFGENSFATLCINSRELAMECI